MSNDPKLKNLLETWRDVEPAPGFEDRVWRRIESGAPVAKPGFISWLLESLREEPSWVPALSAVAGVIVAAFLVLPISQTQASAGLSPLSNGTLSGNYVRLATGATP